MPTATSERLLPSSGIANLRDYGDYGITGGRRLRRGVLFRSGDHASATDDDLDRLGALGLAAIVDLRSETERDLSPSRRPPGFAGQVVWAPSYRAARAPHTAAIAEAPTVDSVTSRLRRAYARIPFQAPMIEAFRLYFQTLASAPGPTLVHCAAGKDRTGIAVALMQAGLGVHRDDITADFLLTNAAGLSDRPMAPGERKLRRAYGETLPDAVVQAVLGVKESYLDAMFHAVSEAGGLDVYLADLLGISEAERERLAEGLVA